MANTPAPNDVVILSATRTPQGKLRGQLASLSAVELGAVALRAAVERSGVDVDSIDQVIFGQVIQAGAGQNPARQTAIAAGLAWKTPTVTINKVCLSGLAAIVDAARLIRLGEANVVAAGGQESMTNAPHVLPGSRMGWAYGTVSALDSAAHDALTDAFDAESMGASTERHNGRLDIGRTEQDEIAAASHQRATAAIEAGIFADEIAPVTIPQRKGDDLVLDTDEGVRANTTVETLAGLRPAFDPEGTITAGNSSPLSDGASAVILASRAWAEEHGLTWLAVLDRSGHVAGPDNSLHSQPARAIAAALDNAGWSARDLDFAEINEAFAAVSLRSTAELGLSHDIVNIHGGAIAIGHPVGASGARLVVHAAHELARRGSGRAAVALCGGGGQGDALLLTR
ncbi:acetyl-CoA C-acetyltransferase [Salinibacterium amurskyense]|uniref:Probable acetyl-CoA acetyltransferase n=1 Tax=Salinibacterium amurskyense TaxID=205941 RepID=A0A2M9D1N5_9MICO|nr:acetyl-CoA C-acetyltransferase [Salinibacterium amurskyense]PJJ78092.1 acetyl-CoA C-acetyltransferase [Salinibacterium amurskyense]RLQ80244.1 acetyl-CoA C-acetyltransferase [Salinibacterium amurskyense]GHD82515.1 acetyl-CoA acetyltransferase [Salinibacterium amurskyense]